MMGFPKESLPNGTDRRRNRFGTSDNVALITLIVAIALPICNAIYIGAVVVTRVQTLEAWMAAKEQTNRETDLRLRGIESKLDTLIGELQGEKEHSHNGKHE